MLIQSWPNRRTGWNLKPSRCHNRLVGRYLYAAYKISKTPRYVVIWTIHWAVIECERLEPGCDLSEAMARTMARLADDGWQAESEAVFGFTFIRNTTERRLLALTERNPADTTLQSFSPF